MCVFFYALLRSMKQHRLSLGAVSCFWATQGGNAFEAQVSVSPYWEKATWQYLENICLKKQQSGTQLVTVKRHYRFYRYNMPIIATIKLPSLIYQNNRQQSF